MPQRQKVRFDEITDIKPATKAKGDPDWWPFREDLLSLEDYPDTIEYTLDPDEKMRTLRGRITRAANSLQMEIRKTETQRGTLLVYKPPTEGRRRRGSKQTEESGEQ